MKKNLHAFFAFLILLIGHQAFTQCDAEFAWEQVPGTLTIHFNNNSTSEHDIVSNVWNFGDGHNGDGENPNHTYAHAGTYNVCLIITDSEGCVADVCHMIVVAPLGGGDCEAGFTWEQINGTLTIHFNNTSTSEHDIVSNVWNFGDGHNGDGQNPNHTYDEPGVYNVCLIITDNAGCVSDVCHEVVVEGSGGGDCSAAFEWEQGNNMVVHFIDHSDDDPDIISWQWTFGDGTSSHDQNPAHEYAEPGVYIVCIRVENEFGCVAELCHEVTVHGNGGGDCSATFEWEQGNNLVVHFIDHSDDDPDIVSWHWSFGDGHFSDDENPVHEYAEPGIYTVCLLVINEFGCAADICHQVHVEGNGGGDCSAAFEWEQGNNLVVHFIDHSDDDPDIVSWQWTFGDGHSSDDQNPVHEYAHPGVYLVCIRVVNEFGCVAELCHEVHVEGSGGEECHAAFEWEQGNNFVVHFIDQSDDDPDIVSWLWTFGDGTSSDSQNPVHEYTAPGVYVVCLIVTNEFGCVSDVCDDIIIHGPEECEALFNFEYGENGAVVFFNNNSTGGSEHTTWLWNFGDGHSSNQENPHHNYEEPGIYTVCLTMTDSLTECYDDICIDLMYQMSFESINNNSNIQTYRTSIIAPTSFTEEDNTILRYTNPASNNLTINYHVGNPGDITFDLTDLTGKRILGVDFGKSSTGNHQREVSLGNIAAGLYMIRLSMEDNIETRVLIVTR